MTKIKKELNIFDYNGVMVADSRDISEILETEHRNILYAVRSIVNSDLFCKEKIDSMFIPVMTKSGRISHFCFTLEACKEFAHIKIMKAKGDDKKKYSDLLHICDKSFSGKKENTKLEIAAETAVPNGLAVQKSDIAFTENMNVTELLHVDYSGECPVISGRELHEALEIKTEYAKWLERMCEYGFTEGKVQVEDQALTMP